MKPARARHEQARASLRGLGLDDKTINDARMEVSDAEAR